MKDESKYSGEILEIAKHTGMDPKAVAEVRALSDSELKSLTEAYVGEDHQSPSYWRLLPARDLAAPYLIEVFDRENPFNPNDESSMLKESAASRALAFLKPGTHDSLKARLLPWLKTGDVRVFRIMARHLTAFGTDDLLPAINAAFENQDGFVSSGARSGALEAIQAGRAEPMFREYVWSHCERLLHAEKQTSMHDPIRLLAAMDKEATKTLLLDSSVMRRDHPLLAEALSTLNNFNSPPDAAFLNSLLVDDTLKPDHRKKRIHASAMFGLIKQKHPSAAQHVERILKDPHQYGDELVFSAWTARFQLRNLTPLRTTAFEAFERDGYELGTLSPDERDLILISYLDSEVRNGGFWQWYFNDFGRFADETNKALEKIGAKEHAKVVAQANRLFGWDGPPRTREKVQRALDAMPEDKARKMDAMNDLWYDLPSWDLLEAAWDWHRQTRGDP